MRILFVATKSPWPPVDGGRLALWLTLQGLAAAGHRIALVAPDGDGGAPAALHALCEPHLVAAGRKSWPRALAGALWRNQALTVARHRLPALERAVVECIESFRPEVVHAEQLQALANCGAAQAAGIPLVLRMQNVESDLWRQIAAADPWLTPLRIEAFRLRAGEAAAMRAAAHVVALTERDAAALRACLGADGGARVSAVAPPFPALLPAVPARDGAPAIVLAGSAGWRPNADGIDWFLRQVVPLLAERLPAARIHLFGGAAGTSGPRVSRHPAPADSQQAFPAGAIAAIPLHIGSGIRMRILEAWARGLPVVATPTAAAGLEVESGRELLIAEGAQAFAAAIASLARDPARAAALVEAGRGYLARRHDSALQSRALAAVYHAAGSEPR